MTNKIRQIGLLVSAFCVLAMLGQSLFAQSSAGAKVAPTAKTDQAKLKSLISKNAPKNARITNEGWFAPAVKDGGKIRSASFSKAMIIPIREDITEKTYQAFKRKVALVKEAKADLLIIDMDTFGGLVISALEITRMIKQDLPDVYVVCYVRTRAISAGAMIAFACDEIIMNPVGKLGDCAPIIPGQNIAPTEREKMEGPLREEFAESATRNGYPKAIAIKMVSTSLSCWLIRNTKTAELKYVLDENWKGKVKVPDWLSYKFGGDEKIISNPNAQWELIGVPWKRSKLVTLTSADAEKIGIVSKLIQAKSGAPYKNLLKDFSETVPSTVLEDNWSENLVDFLSSRLVVGILSFIMLVCGYTELRMPGFGIFGGIAIVCFVLLVGGSYLAGMANWWEIGILVAGVLLLLLEIFVIPGFGIAGILGIICIIAGGLAMLVPNVPGELPIPNTPWLWSYFSQGFIAIMLAFIGATVASYFMSIMLPKIGIVRKASLVLNDAQAAVTSPRSEDSPMLKIQKGDQGIAVSMLRPVGRARFGNALVDVVSDTGLIDAGAKIRVIDRTDNRILVEEIK